MRRRQAAFARRSRCLVAAFVAALAVATMSTAPTFAAPGTSASTPANAATAHAATAAASSQVTYHGGPVLHSNGVFAIFWVPPGYSLPSGYESTITQYFTDVAHDSFLTSNVFGVDTQYYDVTKGEKRWISYSVVYRGTNTDTRAFPKSGCADYVLDTKAGTKSKACLTDAQVRAEIKSVIASHNLPTGIENEYFVFTPPGVATCKSGASETSRNCFDPIQQDGYCAYHSHFSPNGHAVLYDVLPYEDSSSVCWSGQSPNGDVGDSVVNTASHEQSESVTDPLGTGWYDSSGNEVGDKCHLVFGPALSSTSTGTYNEVINGHGYWLQEEWSNRARACVQRNTYPQPKVSFAFLPVAPVHGTTVAFKSSVSESGENTFAYRWTFPDGGVSTAKNPSHRFTKSVFVGIVTLIVSDPHGDQTRVTKSITVT